MPVRWGELFPWPLVGVTVLLAMLIVLTPNLLSVAGGPSAGSLEAQAVLVIDRAPGASATELYVHGIGLVRYTNATIATANSSYPPGGPLGPWTRVGAGSETLAINATIVRDPFGVRVAVEYTDPSGTVLWYVGTYVVYASADTLYVDPLDPGAASVSPTPLGQLPISLLLPTSSTGGST